MPGEIDFILSGVLGSCSAWPVKLHGICLLIAKYNTIHFMSAVNFPIGHSVVVLQMRKDRASILQGKMAGDLGGSLWGQNKGIHLLE